MEGIPPARNTDAEDVVWALQTADALWKRHERVDAIVWLRRAAQAAGDAADDDRATALARSAAELTESLATVPEAAPSAPEGTVADSQIDDLLRASAHGLTSELVAEDEEEGARLSVPSADQRHAGMLDPWSAPPPVPSRAPRKSTPPPAFKDDEVVTSARFVSPPADAFPDSDEVPTNAKGTRKPDSEPQPSLHRAPDSGLPVSSFEVVATQTSKKPPPIPRPGPPPLRKRTQPPPLPASATVPAPAPALLPNVATAPLPPPVLTAIETPIPSGDMVPVAAVDLAPFEAFADLPDAARDAFAMNARVTDLAKDEEAGNFALALILDGSVDVSATMVDAPAVHCPTGTVLRSRGSIEDQVSLRLICATETATVAVWQEADVATAFKTCPWVEDDLRAAANRTQALAGVTVGPLGERLDRSLRDLVMSRLEMRVLAPGEVIVQKGKPLPGLIIVGVGDVELLDGDVIMQTLGSGEFLFADAILGAGSAPLTARVGKGGALAMCASRALAQELLVTCPPLLELFAGM